MIKSIIINVLLTIVLGGTLGCSKDEIDINGIGPIKGGKYYVATWGSDMNPSGTFDKPWATWQKAFEMAEPGDTVYFRGGVWYPKTDDAGNVTRIMPLLGTGNNGTAENPICYFNYPGETPILDCTNVNPKVNGMNGIMLQGATYLKFKGLIIRNVFQKNDQMESRGIFSFDVGHLYFEQMTACDINGPGFFIQGYDTVYYINCDSYNCLDTKWYNPKISKGDGFFVNDGGNRPNSYAYLYGCRAWNCRDDGFDISSASFGEINTCWSFGHGAFDGEGNGFKYGWIVTPYDFLQRKVVNCISAYNTFMAFYECNLIYDINSVTYNNTAYKCWSGFGNTRYTQGGPKMAIYRNNISYDNSDENYPDQKYTVPNYNEQTYFMGIIHVQDHNTWIPTIVDPFWAYNPDIKVTDDDFISINPRELIRDRLADGTLPDINFLKLKKDNPLKSAGINVGMSNPAPVGVDWDFVKSRNKK